MGALGGRGFARSCGLKPAASGNPPIRIEEELNMAIFLDSANPQHAVDAFPLGFLAGVTTNPALLATQGTDPLNTIRQVAEHSSGLIFYPPLAESVEAMEEEIRRVHVFLGERLVAKIPCSPAGFELVARLPDDMPRAMTAGFS